MNQCTQRSQSRPVGWTAIGRRSSPAFDLYLMRHGETLWNLEGRLQGHADSPLSDRGLRQAGWLASLTQGIAGVRIASPLGRADHTARIAFGATYRRDQRLTEICVGDFTGQLTQDMRRAYPDVFAGEGLDWYDSCPKGEGFAALQARCRSFLNDLDGPTLVVTHAITLRMLRLLALNQPVDMLGAGVVHQGRVHAIRGGIETVLRHPDDL